MSLIGSLDPLIAGFWFFLGSSCKGFREIDRGFRVFFFDGKPLPLMTQIFGAQGLLWRRNDALDRAVERFLGSIKFAVLRVPLLFLKHLVGFLGRKLAH